MQTDSPQPASPFAEGLLQQQVTIVTGTGQLMADAIARRFAKAGARLVLVHLPEHEAAANELGQKLGAAMVLSCELSDPQSVSATVRRVVTELGGVDILVNANVTRSPGLLSDFSLDQWKHVIERQLSGTVYFCKEVIRPMMRKRAGRIMTVLDIAPGSASVVAAKGIAAMTRSLASEVARQGIYVNNLVVNVLLEEVDSLTPAQRGRIDTEVGPLNRLGSADEIAESALFLATSAANLMTGNSLSASGGLW